MRNGAADHEVFCCTFSLERFFMKRILPVLLSVALILSCLLVPVLAYDEPGNQYNDNYKNGELYGKIINWQNYVVSSTEVNGKWDTVCKIPQHSLWELYDAQGSVGPKTYTNFSHQKFYLEERDNVVWWQIPYYLSLEDINSIDPNVFDFTVSVDLPMEYVVVEVILLDQYMSHVKTIEKTYYRHQFEYDYTYLRTGAIQWNGGEGWEGAKYVKFSAEIYFQEILEPTWVVLSNIDWTISLPFEYDPLRYPVDNIDSWMNGYFKPIVPDSSGEIDIWEHFRQNQALFKEFITSVRDTFSYYSQGFRFWSFAFLQFYSINWVGQLVNASIAIGAIAFFFGIAIEASGKIGSKKGKGKDNRTHSTSTARPDKHTKIKKKGD